MRALVMSEPAPGPERTAVRDVPEPRPADGQVTIEVAHAGVNFLDVMARRGDPGYAPSWPYLAGLEVAGRIHEAGPGVGGLAPGQRVAAFTRGGGFAELAVAEASSVVPLPDAVPTEIAAAAPLMLSTALLLLTDVAGVREGDVVVMHSAAGGVGGAVAQLVPVLRGGARIGTVGRPEKVSEAVAAGWDVVLPRAEATPEKVRASARGGVDVVLDPLGTSMIEFDLEIAAPGARIALFGNPSGAAPSPLPGLGRLIGGNVALAGFSMSGLTANAPHRAANALRRVLDLVADGRLSPAVSVIERLEDVSAAHQLISEGRGVGKYVVGVGS